jgi:hypothetical protein
VRGSVWRLLSIEKTSFAASLPSRIWFAVSFPQATLSHKAVISQLVSLGAQRCKRDLPASYIEVIESRFQRYPIANNRVPGSSPQAQIYVHLWRSCCTFRSQVGAVHPNRPTLALFNPGIGD